MASKEVVLVAGGAGTVGSGIALQFLKEGKLVVVPSRRKEALEELKKQVDKEFSSNLITIHQTEEDPEKAAAHLKNEILEKYGHVDHVVSSLGSWWQNSHPTETSVSEYLELLRNLLLSHFVIAQQFLTVPNLKTYTIITGAAGERVMFSKMGLLTSAVSGLFGLIKALNKEIEEKKLSVKLNELRIAAYIQKPSEVTQSSFSNQVIGEYVSKIVKQDVGGKTYSFRNTTDLEQLTTR
ncbi:hypothetical protein C9374_004548 [Naegleria lovaniensis]|uniref:Uncharacterized protein n=1 Tax=Naegleria lovaniensis TaxID=51637 RepID=A0AA88KP18_NAELO|nr:uncharacterized protein C9374_004548 [Naegleria lovaniensis]KAG2383211.1 hypothetical protein C9374_004548 [Naegleria lovaniensis]